MTRHDLYGYNSGRDYPITEIRREDKVVIAQAVMPDIDVEEMSLGN